MDLERRLGALEVLDRRVALAGLDVDQHEVALAERAARAVLAGEAQRASLRQQRPERERLGLAPVDGVVRPDLGALRALRRELAGAR